MSALARRRKLHGDCKLYLRGGLPAPFFDRYSLRVGGIDSKIITLGAEQRIIFNRDGPLASARPSNSANSGCSPADS